MTIRRCIVSILVVLLLYACGSVSDPASPDGGGEDASGQDALASDADALPSLPNIAEVIGRPWSQTAPFTVNPAWQTTCAAELPLMSSPTPPAMPAADDNCAGNPALCGSSRDQDCRSEPALSNWLHRATIDTTTFPNAVCNDGSPAIVEIRKGHGAGVNNWLIWLKGGGGCGSQHMCARRWCGNQSGDKYRASIMSNDWNGDGVIDQAHCARTEAGSAFDASLAGNPFADANIVKIRYCSSDSHTGDANDVPFADDSDDDASDRPFSVHFRGHAVVAAVVASLKAGVVSDDGVVLLPSIDTATRVVLSGSSAGAGGALHNMDYMHEQFRATNSDVVVRGVLDANIKPSFDVLERYGVFVDSELDGMNSPGTGWASFSRDLFTTAWTNSRTPMNAFTDQSCTAHYDGQADLMHNCLQAASLLTGDANGVPFVETKIFLRRDLADPTAGKPYGECVVDQVTDQPCYDPNHSFLAYESQSPSRWLTLVDGTNHVGETLDEVFASASVSGVFAPLCRTHTGFTNRGFSGQFATHYDDALGQFSGSSRSFMQTLSYWLNTDQPVKVIDASADEDTRSSVCGAP